MDNLPTLPKTVSSMQDEFRVDAMSTNKIVVHSGNLVESSNKITNGTNQLEGIIDEINNAYNSLDAEIKSELSLDLTNISYQIAANITVLNYIKKLLDSKAMLAQELNNQLTSSVPSPFNANYSVKLNSLSAEQLNLLQKYYDSQTQNLSAEKKQQLQKEVEEMLNSRGLRLEEVTALHQNASGVGSIEMGNGYHMSDSGCCVSSTAAMYYLFTGNMPDVPTFINDMKSVGGWYDGNGCGEAMFGEENTSSIMSEKYGLTGHNIRNDSINDVVDVLNNGDKILISVHSPTFGGMTSGHYIVMDHYNSETNQIYVYNPGGAEVIMI